MAKKPAAPDAEPAPVEEMDLGAAEVEAEIDASMLIEEAPAEAVETPALTAEELADIDLRAAKEIDAEFRKQLKTEALEKAKERQRRKLSMHVNKHLNGALSDMVRITINIPDFSNTPWIQVGLPNGNCYLHGSSYTVPRHVGNSLRETMQWMRRHQAEIDGKKRNPIIENPNGSFNFVDAVTGFRTSGRVVSGTAV